MTERAMRHAKMGLTGACMEKIQMVSHSANQRKVEIQDGTTGVIAGHVKMCGDWATPHLRQHRDPTCIPRPRRFGKRATAVSFSRFCVCISYGLSAVALFLPDVSP